MCDPSKSDYCAFNQKLPMLPQSTVPGLLPPAMAPMMHPVTSSDMLHTGASLGHYFNSLDVKIF